MLKYGNYPRISPDETLFPNLNPQSMKNLLSVSPRELLSIAIMTVVMFSCKTDENDIINKLPAEADTKAKAAAVAPQISLTSVISTGLSAPMQFVHAGDGSKRVFIPQKGGAIRVYDSAFNFISVFGTVTGITTNGERGLLSLVFHPDYATNGFVYVYYTNASGNLELARYHVNSSTPNAWDASSKVIVLTIPHPTNSNHNGGELHFGTDGYLYLSTGDGGGAGDVPNNAQNTSVLLGKVLRLNVNTSASAPYYSIPPGNPFSNEVYAYGLRNPYRWSFDKATQDMWIGDVGQDSWEEINFRAAAATSGANYGWRCYEGNNAFNTSGCTGSNYIFPVHAYATQNPAASITGGVVYRGTTYPSLQGVYLSADFYSGIFYKIVPNGSGGWDITTQTLSPTGIVDFGETESGEVYVVSHTGNSVYRVTAN
jgi:glucose/arabinose dehydrogenase